MYINLICFLITALIFTVYGKCFILYFDKTKVQNYSLFDVFFIGLCTVGTFLNFWSLFLPTNIWSLLFLILTSSFLFYKNYKIVTKTFHDLFNKLKNEKFFLFIILISTIIILLYSVITPRNPDTFLYHIGAIQWNEFYSVVPGLANFHDRLGFNSSIFILSAGFSFSAIYNEYIFIINSLSFFIFFIWLLKQIYFQKGFFGLFSLLFLYFFILQYAQDISSPGTDLLPNLFVGYIFLSLLFYKESLTDKPLLYIVMPLFCITLKLSTFPIVFICFAAIYMRNEAFLKSTGKLILYGALFVLPWIIRNVILSGYLIYPNVFLDFFSFDWKVPKGKVIVTQNWIYSFGKIPFRHYAEVLKMPFKEWFPIWWEASLIKNKYLYILAFLSPVFYGIYILLHREQRKKSNILVIVVAYLGLLTWFFMAPDVRFSAGFIIILALLPLFLFKQLITKFSRFFNCVMFGALIYIFIIFSQTGFALFNEDYKLKKISQYIYLPNDVSEIKDKRYIPFNEFYLRTKTGKSIKIFSSVGETPTYDKFPCTVNFFNGCRLRGDDLKNGFISN